MLRAPPAAVCRPTQARNFERTCGGGRTVPSERISRVPSLARGLTRMRGLANGSDNLRDRHRRRLVPPSPFERMCQRLHAPTPRTTNARGRGLIIALVSLRARTSGFRPRHTRSASACPCAGYALRLAVRRAHSESHVARRRLPPRCARKSIKSSRSPADARCIHQDRSPPRLVEVQPAWPRPQSAL